MKSQWLSEFIDSIAERGRELLGLETAPQATELEALCQRLLTGHGEASGIALSQQILQVYAGLDAEQKLAFFQMLDKSFSPDLDAIVSATEAYRQQPTADALLALNHAVEPPRQELFRRMNMAPGGTASLVSMREDLLGLLRKHPQLRAVDADLKHLLSSWFNRGFLQLRSIDWHSPAHVLEKLINYEAVHEIQGWDDLRRRLMKDRRCFAFFHPAMDEEPLIFVEVALVKGMSAEVATLIAPDAPELDPLDADTAIFYSINNTQRGLRGISFGNFLIKQVLNELHGEFPAIKCSATLSPMPLFASTLSDALDSERGFLTVAQLESLLAEYRDDLCDSAGENSPVAALRTLLSDDPLKYRAQLTEPLSQLALAYLTRQRHANTLLDPVATFHLSNGASIERINPFADVSAHGISTSFGMMVNYLYDPAKVESNHERFVNLGEFSMSDNVSKRYRKIAALLRPDDET